MWYLCVLVPNAVGRVASLPGDGGKLGGELLPVWVVVSPSLLAGRRVKDATGCMWALGSRAGQSSSRDSPPAPHPASSRD